MGDPKISKDPEWGAPLFAQSKPKTNPVIFPSEFWYLNKKLKCKPYPMPNINEILLKLEGFQYAISFDLNVGYYDIQITEEENNLCAIILQCGKYCYKHLTMRVSNWPEIFQHKTNDLFQIFEFICAYIDDFWY